MARVTKPSRRWKLNNWLWLTVEAFEEWSDALFAQACWEAGMKERPPNYFIGGSPNYFVSAFAGFTWPA
jgi:hypothetical protein